MHGPLRLSYALLANYMAKCQMSSGPYGPIFIGLMPLFSLFCSFGDKSMVIMAVVPGHYIFPLDR